MGTLEQLLPALSDNRDPNGNPKKGKLQTLTLSTTFDGWQAIAQFWFYPKWNVCVSDDPLAAMVNVLSRGPEEFPEKANTVPSALLRGDLAASDSNMVSQSKPKSEDLFDF